MSFKQLRFPDYVTDSQRNEHLTFWEHEISLQRSFEYEADLIFPFIDPNKSRYQDICRTSIWIYIGLKICSKCNYRYERKILKCLKVRVYNAENMVLCMIQDTEV